MPDRFLHVDVQLEWNVIITAVDSRRIHAGDDFGRFGGHWPARRGRHGDVLLTIGRGFVHHEYLFAWSSGRSIKCARVVRSLAVAVHGGSWRGESAPYEHKIVELI